MSELTTRKKVRVPVVMFSLLVLLLSIVMVWGSSSDWGGVKMQRITFTYATDNAAYTGSYIIFIPKTATAENKVPGIVVLGGASSYSYALKSYGIELSRRGYAVLLCDMPGQALSSMVGHDGGYQNYAPGVGEDATAFIQAVITHIQNLNFVDQDNLIVSGFSAGQGWALQGVLANPDVFKTLITLSGYRPDYAKQANAIGVNFVGIKADGSTAPPVTPEFETIPGQFTGSGSFDDGTANYCFVNIHAVQHQTQPINGRLIAAIVEGAQMSSPPQTKLAHNDQIYMGAEIWSAVAIISLFVFLAYLMKAMLTMQVFQSLARPEPAKYPVMCGADPNPKKRKLKSIAFLSGRILLVMLLYYVFAVITQIIPLFSGTRWAGLWFNIWIPFLVATALTNLIVFLTWHFKHGKPNGGNAYNYGIGWGKSAGNWKNIGKSLLLGVVVLYFLLALLSFLDTLLTVNLKVMIFGLITFNMEHMTQMPFYILFFIGILFCASLTQYITNPAHDDGSTRGQIIATTRTTIIAILPFVLLVTWNTLKGMNIIHPMGTYTLDQLAPLDNMYGYPIMMALVTPIMDVLRRKTKSIWPGVIICAMLIGVLIGCNYALNETWFG